MSNLRQLIGIFLIVFVARIVFGDRCDIPNVKLQYSYIFCDEATSTCSNETEEVILDDLRDCYAKNSEDAKKLIETVNKLQPDQCLEEVGKSVCNFANELDQNAEKFKDCFQLMRHAYSALPRCSLDYNKKFEAKQVDLKAAIVCTDTVKFKCESKEVLDALNAFKKCLIEYIPGLKELKNTGDENECKPEARVHLMNAIQESDYKEYNDCMNAIKDMMETNNPILKCEGIKGFFS